MADHYYVSEDLTCFQRSARTALRALDICQRDPSLPPRVADSTPRRFQPDEPHEFDNAAPEAMPHRSAFGNGTRAHAISVAAGATDAAPCQGAARTTRTRMHDAQGRLGDVHQRH
jgi:hypothetical protein